MKQGKISVGHPVDVASGEVYITRTDFWLKGKYPLNWQRRYTSANVATTPGPLGIGWSADFYLGLAYEADTYYLLTPAGKAETFCDPDQACKGGRVIYNFESNKDLRYSDGHYLVTSWNHDSDKVESLLFSDRSCNGIWPLKSLAYVSSGFGAEFFFDDALRLVKIQQQLEKRALRFVYDRNNRLVEVRLNTPGKEPLPMVRYAYTSDGLLSKVIDSLGYQEQYVYDRKGRIVQERLRSGTEFIFKYDESGRCIHTSGADGYDAKTLHYLINSGWTEVVDSKKNITQYQWNADGQVIMEADPAGAVKKTTYDLHGRTIETVNPNGETTRYEYDEHGNRAVVMDPLAQRREFVFNEYHQAVSYTDAGGSNWKRDYDAKHRLRRITNPLDQKWRFDYDEHDNIVEAHLGAAVIRHRFSPDGNLEQSMDPEGNITRFQHNAFGDQVSITGPAGSTKSYEYDMLGRIIKETHETLTLDYRYDAAGNLTSIEDNSGSRTHFSYATCGRLSTIRGPLGEPVHLNWDSEPYMLTAITNAKGESCRFVYNEAGRIIERAGYGGSKTYFDYDPAGRLIGCRDDFGTEITYTRDSLGRLLKIAAADGYRADFAYDYNDAFVEASNPDVAIRYERDQLGRIVKEYQGDHAIEYTYTAQNNVESVRTDHVLIEYAYSARRLLSEIRVNGNQRIEFERNSMGSETVRRLPGRMEVRQEVDTLGRLLEQTAYHNHGFQSKPVHRTYDWNGLCVTRMWDSKRGAFEFFYDAAEQLIAARDPSGTHEFSYDASGNLVEERNGTQVESFRYETGDRLVWRANIQYEYDFAGRLIKIIPYNDGAVKLTWNMLNQLRSVNVKGQAVTYRYDPFGRRIGKNGNGAPALFIWDRGTILHEITSRAVSTWIYDVHSYKPVAHMVDDDFYAVICDHLGTPREIITTSGETAWSAAIDSWGKTERIEATSAAHPSVKCPIRFQGQWFDEESGFHYSRYRYYDPAARRFISPDPSGLKGGLNLYRYCINPVNWIDPLGLDWNYVVLGQTDDGESVHYTGVASDNDTPAGVMSRHRRTEGDDSSVRFDDQNGDRLVQVTPEGTPHDTARGLEHEIADEYGTVIGRRGSSTNKEGSVRGNLQNPVDQSDSNTIKRDRRKELADAYVKKRKTTVRALVEDAIDRDKKNSDEEGCA